MIKASDYIKTAFSANDAEKIYTAIILSLSDNNTVEVDFEGVSIFTTLFFNNAFAKFIIEMGPEKYDKTIKLTKLSELGESTYKHSYDNAINYYQLSQEEKTKQEQILGTPEETGE